MKLSAPLIFSRIAALIIFGFGTGCGVQQPLIAAQTVFKGPDIALSVSALIFLQTLSGAVFLAISQSIFQNRVVTQMHKLVPEVDPAVVLGTGASDLHAMINERYPQYRDEILQVYNNGIQQVFLIGLVLACVTIFGAVGMEWKSVKKAPAKKSEPPSEEKEQGKQEEKKNEEGDNEEEKNQGGVDKTGAA